MATNKKHFHGIKILKIELISMSFHEYRKLTSSYKRQETFEFI